MACGMRVRPVRRFDRWRRWPAWVFLLSGGGAVMVAGCGHSHRRGSTAPPTAASTTAPATTATTGATPSVSGSSRPTTAANRPATSVSGGKEPTAPGSSATAGVPTTPGVPVTAPSGVPANGVYVDGPPGVPRYLISLQDHGATAAGTITFVYQDGRRQTVASYTAQFGASQALRMNLSTGMTVTGMYRRYAFTLANCGTVLPFAAQSSSCDFAYTASA
jgi:hypothetical protein